MEESFAYLAANAGEVASLRFAHDLAVKLEWLAHSGTAGVSRTLISPGLRMLVFKSYCIYFRIADDECRIVRFLSARRDISVQSFSGEED